MTLDRTPPACLPSLLPVRPLFALLSVSIVPGMADISPPTDRRTTNRLADSMALALARSVGLARVRSLSILMSTFAQTGPPGRTDRPTDRQTGRDSWRDRRTDGGGREGEVRSAKHAMFFARVKSHRCHYCARAGNATDGDGRERMDGRRPSVKLAPSPAPPPSLTPPLT